MNKFRRYSINIPHYYGEREPEIKDKPIPDEELAKTLEELQKRVEGITGVSRLKYFPRIPSDVLPFEGVWRSIWDVGVIIYIDIPITGKKKMDIYLSKYKEILAERFGQAEMYIVSWEIEVI